MPRMKNLNLNVFGANGADGGGNGLSGVGNGLSGQNGADGISVSGANGITQRNSGGSSYNIDVQGNGCACVNGVCEGNCSDMEQIDLDNFDPLSWVESHI